MDIIGIVNNIISTAVNLGGSDIHLEPSKSNLRIRFRIDGILYDQEPINSDIALQVISRIKVLGYMDISEHRLPQDGKYSGFELPNKKIVDIRIASFPTLHGEKVVLRLLDRSINKLDLDNLGFDNKILVNLKRLSKKPTGLFLVTGPTGSGKTTTLHSMLAYGANAEKNIVTLEDPIEYHIDNIIQSQIYPEIGFTFERGIRSLLRQDPDVIMVGEIRDKETAQVAIQAALTGHLVLTTLHTNDAIGSLLRLLDMGIEPFLVNGAVTGILNQRLIRKLCSCAELDTNIIDSVLPEKFGLSNIYKPVGCNLCNNLGYKGRIALGELLLVSNSIRLLVTKSIDFVGLYNQALKDGMIPIVEQAINKVHEGLLSLNEFVKIVS